MNRYMKHYILFISLVICAVLHADGFQITSPDGRISARVAADGADAGLKWEVSCDGKPICAKSSLGLMVDGVDMSHNITLKEVGSNFISDRYSIVSHESPIETAANEMILEAVPASGDGIRMLVEVRCYDGGAAYRLRVPGSGLRHVDAELAEFRLPTSGMAWFAERNSAWKLKTYAGEFTKAPVLDLHKVSQQGPVQMMPLLCQAYDSLFIMLTESGLFNYSGMRLRALSSGSLVADFTESDGFDVDGEIVTPWRVLVIERDLTGLANSHLVYDLAPEPDPDLFADMSWVRPGRSVWSWWSNIDSRFMDDEAEREVIDRGADLGFEYTTIDEGWEDRADKWEFVTSLAEYGAAKGVGVLLWRHSNRLDNPEHDYRTMAMFMDSVAATGAKGLKIDFMNGESKRIIDFTTRALQMAAERKLLINFHGCQKPSGEIRTYPNELTREGVRGLELNRITADYRRQMASKGVKVDDRPHVVGDENQCIPACHNVILPLTRGVLGSMDYTPVGFSMPGNTTWAHQLATGYVMQSSLLTFAENPFYLFREPALRALLPFVAALPVVYDKSIVLPPTRLGKSLIMARQSGGDWYVAGLSVDGYAGAVDLGFLDAGIKYDGEWVMDSPESDKAVIIGSGEYVKNGIFNAEMRPNGGFVLRLHRR